MDEFIVRNAWAMMAELMQEKREEEAGLKEIDLTQEQVKHILITDIYRGKFFRKFRKSGRHSDFN